MICNGKVAIVTGAAGKRIDPQSAIKDVRDEVAPVYYLMPLVLPGMYERGWGRVVGISLHPTKFPPAHS